jgi:hypothetical protein
VALPLPPPRNRPGALVASASNLSLAGRESSETFNGRRALDWQRRALAYCDQIPELSYSSRFYARMLSKLRIYPAEKTATSQPKEIKSGVPKEVLDRIHDKAGGMTQILSNYGRLMFATGDGVLLALNLGTPDEFWNFVWHDEVKIEMANKRVRKITHMPNGEAGDRTEFSPEQARAYRMWTSHPRRSGEADSPMRSSLDIAEELLILTSAVRSTAVSRITQGILLMPIEIAPVPAEAGGDEDLENDPYIADFTQHIEAQIENAGSASAAAPYINWASYEYLDRIRLVQLHDPQTDYMERQLRSEAVERLARGFDFPPEVLVGLSSANHWAARQILDDMWRSHGAPIAQQFCNDLNDAYLRPALREEKFAGWENVVIAYDESAVVVQPDRSGDADSAFDRGAISNEGYRRLKNIPEEYKQSAEEHDEWLAIKLRDTSLIDPALAPPDPTRGPPPPGPEGDSGRQTRVVASTSSLAELGAIEMALARCRELAGIRLRQKEKNLGLDLLAQANGRPNETLASIVGAESLHLFQTTAPVLVQGGADTLRIVLANWGYGETQVAAIAELVESYASRTLFESRQPALPSGFAAHLERAKEVSNV